MKRFLCLFMLIAILLVGCTPSQTMQTESPEQIEQSEQSKQSEQIEQSEESKQPNQSEQLEESELYKTILSPNNKLSIVRKPSAADYSHINPGKMTKLPSYDPNSDGLWQIDLRSSDLTNLNLSERLNDLLHADFDSKTQWPDKLPNDFDPQVIMDLGKNPGLGLRELHKKGITGKGIGLAIIDQGLLVDHVEYKEQLKLYEEIHCSDEFAAMHGPAVASIAVGKTIGVAPEADLYYIARTNGTYNKQQFDRDLSWTAKSIDRIVEINKTLPEEKKIKVISISVGMGRNMNGYEKVFESIEKAKQEGIYTISVDSKPYMGLGRNPLKSADDITSFTKGEFWKDDGYSNSCLLIPMDSRCTASPTGVNDYVFSRVGGLSWTVPYVAGLYALACQANPDITPDVFWQEAFNTSDTVSVDNDTEETFGKIVNPAKLIEKIEKLK